MGKNESSNGLDNTGEITYYIGKPLYSGVKSIWVNGNDKKAAFTSHEGKRN